MERLSDGKLMLGGDFIRVGTQVRPGLARLNPNGTVDTTFVPNVSAGFGLQQLMTDSTGRTYVLDGSSLRRLSATGALDTSFVAVRFNPTFARSMAMVSDGVIVGGDFTTAASLPRIGLVKIGFDGSVEPNFVVNTNDVTTVLGIGVDEVLVAGGFTTIGGVARTGVAKLSTTGSGLVRGDWNPNLTNAAGAVRISDALMASGALYLTGTFDALGGTPRLRLAKLALAAGAALDSAWNISAPTLSNARLFQHNGSLLVATSAFTVYANPPAAGLAARRLLRAPLASGVIDASFTPLINEDGAPDAVALVTGDSAARLVIGGSFISIGNTARFSLAQLNADGSLDAVSAISEAAALGAVNQIAFDPANQRSYLSGNFLRADGAALRYCLRLDANGRVDTNWRPQIDDRLNPAIAVVPGSGVWVATNSGIARLNETDGLRIGSWVNSTAGITKLLFANAAIYANTAQLTRFPVIGNGIADPAFAPVPNGPVNQMRFDASGNTLVVSGIFSQIGGGARARLARINAATGALVGSFDPNFADVSGEVGVQGFDLDGTGGVWAAGNFITVNGVPRVSPVRLLLSNGDIDPASAASPSALFNNGLDFSDGFFYGLRFTGGGNAEMLRVPNTGGGRDLSWRMASNGSVDAIAFDSSRVLVGGKFSQTGSSQRLACASLPKTDPIFRDGFD
jgi:Domain of unknown function (DUF5122) beta-propeller